MKFKISKSQWTEMGKKAGWADSYTKFNLDIAQLTNYANQMTMFGYIDEIEKRNGKSWETEQLRKFLKQLHENSKKIALLFREYEKGLEVGERRPIGEDKDDITGEKSYKSPAEKV